MEKEDLQLGKHLKLTWYVDGINKIKEKECQSQ